MGMSDTRTVNVRGHGRPSRLMIRMALARHGKKFAHSVDSMLEDAVAVRAMAGLLDRAFNHALKGDGRLDLNDAAIYMIREMRRHQK